MWFARMDKEPRNPKMLPLYEEHLADRRKEDYYHLITIHDECPVADDCLQQIIDDLCFESKPEMAYVDREHFRDTVQNILTYYVGIVATPQEEVKKHLRIISKNIGFSFV